MPECIEDGVDKAARIEKLDTEVDQVQIKGLEITSLDDKVRTVTISVDTGKDNFAPPSGNGSRSYPVSLFFGGSATSLPTMRREPLGLHACSKIRRMRRPMRPRRVQDRS